MKKQGAWIVAIILFSLLCLFLFSQSEVGKFIPAPTTSTTVAKPIPEKWSPAAVNATLKANNCFTVPDPVNPGEFVNGGDPKCNSAWSAALLECTSHECYFVNDSNVCTYDWECEKTKGYTLYPCKIIGQSKQYYQRHNCQGF